MRSTIAITLAAAAVAVSAQNCNPSYNVPGSTDCFTSCNVKAGQEFVSGWTMDSSSPKFLDSLKLMCTKGTTDYMSFMTKAGTCMAACAGDDPELFNAEFQGACAWYAQHSGDTCASATTAAQTTTATQTTAATTATAAQTTTVAQTTTASVTSASGSASSAASSVATALSSGASLASNASSIIGASASAVSSNATAPAAASSVSVPATQAESAANKLQLGSYAVALVACAGYLAL
ncbi:hypothetical protein V8B55DRAFT_1390225 [Mucor lusitanicus]|uniref:Uncharacterized protein n=1 Tax=Mucor circinelloides f. lusitanicus TaxID=29924 RepID=A0A8H4BEX6_MUCCL|nr:hypothetical protein FB192DRAFT_1383602 [Mucor lusitanicus]